MTPAEVILALRNLNVWRQGKRDLTSLDLQQFWQALAAATEMIERMERDLRLIAETDPVDAALDPQRAVRVARAALEELK